MSILLSFWILLTFTRFVIQTPTFRSKEAIDDFSVAVTYDEIIAKKYSLAAGQYFDVRIEYVELTHEEFNAKMAEFKSELQSFFDEDNVLQVEIMKQLGKVKYE